MSDAVQQIQCSYSAEQDRLLLELSTAKRSAYRIWLTRRFVGLLWQRLVGSLAKAPEVVVQKAPRAKRTVMAFQKEKAVQAAEFSKPYEKADLVYPLGEAPLLPTKFTLEPAAGAFTRVAFATADDTSVAVNLNRDQIYSLCHLMIAATGKSEWGLNLAIDDPDAAAAPAEAHRLH